MLFSGFWARIYEVGNFPVFTKNRYIYYGVCITIPSIIHAFYGSSKMNTLFSALDTKYSPIY
jgi:hypothetical protein